MKRRRTRKIKSAATVSDDPPSPGHDQILPDQTLPPSANDESIATTDKKDKPTNYEWSQEDLSLYHPI